MQINLPLKTERLILRDFVESDWPAVHCYASDVEVVRFMAWGPNDEEATRANMQRRLDDQRANPRYSFELAVMLKSGGQLIGGGRLNIADAKSRQGRIAYIFNRNYWGRGYATEAASAIIAFGFEQLGMHRIFATCDPRNTASAHVLEKIGMRREGHHREDQWRRGEWRDSYLYAILEQEWRNNARHLKRKKILDLEGKVKWIGNLSEMRKSRI